MRALEKIILLCFAAAVFGKGKTSDMSSNLEEEKKKASEDAHAYVCEWTQDRMEDRAQERVKRVQRPSGVISISYGHRKSVKECDERVEGSRNTKEGCGIEEAIR